MTTDRDNSEAGFTLVELLVGMAMSLIIVVAAVAMFTNTLHRQPEETATADVLGTARNAVEKITTDLREGEKATLTAPSSLVLTTPCAKSGSNEGKCQISYRCAKETKLTTFDCTRMAEGQTTTIVKGLASGEVFCVFPNADGKECGSESPLAEKEPRYVGIMLQFPNHKEAAATTILEDGAALHNRGLEGLVPQ